ncbi:MAG TPA: efflux RND transporter periplasmic adaptor subunit [Chitinophaga sp.]|uniref:efflux RND transporter periplasmic adaptor subunit n=1 Tax=Chitinophaga sp. TaxID=1869181 RepID=UPI002DBB5A53|nr:efflux RND transporter periplasmic adaptor subunit [Chitinophaga sp.]HEU4551968.1 efflux RND transporter periplasmic adaptor subunit [Chitinophaga sp.]
MKRNYIVSITAAFTLLGIACRQQGRHAAPAHAAMEHSYSVDSSLLPLLQPVNEQVLAQIGTVQPVQQHDTIIKEIQGAVTYDTRSETSIASRVAGRIEKLYITYNYQPVKKGQLLMQVYSPELVAAQRELLFIRETGDNAALLNSARQRLLLLGMTGAQIARVLSSRQPVYKIPVYSNANGYIIDKTSAVQVVAIPPAPPAAGDMNGMSGTATPPPAAAQNGNTVAAPMLLREGQYVNAGETIFTIYKADKLVAEFALEPATAAYIRKGRPLTLQSSSGDEKAITATVGLIQPSFRNGENFTLVRAYLQGQPFNAGTLLKARIPVMEKAAWWLPEAAVVQLGTRAVVFRKEGAVYRPVAIATGMKAGGRVQVPDSIAGWQVARNAWYLVDSESFIKTATTKQP